MDLDSRILATPAGKTFVHTPNPLRTIRRHFVGRGNVTAIGSITVLSESSTARVIAVLIAQRNGGVFAAINAIPDRPLADPPTRQNAQ
ncbi:hypothetical protein ABIB51_004493 [Arthrobacter sp. UYCu712]